MTLTTSSSSMKQGIASRCASKMSSIDVNCAAKSGNLRREQLLYILGVPAFLGLMIGSIMGIGIIDDKWISPHLEQWFGEKVGHVVGSVVGLLCLGLLWLLIAICTKPIAGVKAIVRTFRDKEQRVAVLILLVIVLLFFVIREIAEVTSPGHLTWHDIE